jgi:NADPH:quinone reductase-like Zn-dependent oxidoreductase
VRAVVIESFGGPGALRPADVPSPEPAGNEVLIEVAYAAVNPVDWKIREGMLSGLFPHEFPVILGWDAAGTVKDKGKNVTGFSIGDRVYAYCRKPKVQFGTVRPPTLVEIRLKEAAGAQRLSQVAASGERSC